MPRTASTRPNVVNPNGAIIGPYRRLSLPDGRSAPLFIIPFDRDGVCLAPRTRTALLEEVSTGQPSHVFFFSHGWNNDWPEAIDKYTTFIDGFAGTRAVHPVPGCFRPVLIGIFWPSAVLVKEEDKAPVIAGEPLSVGDEDGAQLADLMTLAEELDPALRDRLYWLTQLPDLTDSEAEELAGMLRPVWGGRPWDAGETDELQSNPRLRTEELITLWQRAAMLSGNPQESAAAAQGVSPSQAPPGPFSAGPGAGPAAAFAVSPAAAGLLDKLSPRNIVRTATVLLMKDRAGRVGARGVSRLLEEVLAATTVPLHLVGHSYGCKVVMSALCRVPLSTRPVESVLLLQPAISYLALAAHVPGVGAPGGYRPALTRSVQPIRATFSKFDEPLTKYFHLAVRRASDLGDVRIAGAPPSRYSAMGGFGPAEGPEVARVSANSPGTRYKSPAHARVLGVDASNVISSHSDINNPATWWMLLDQVLGQP